MGRDILRNLQKDFRIEFRSRFAVNIAVAFAGIVTVSISLTAGGAPFPVKVQSILFWVVIFFSAMNGLAHIFVREEDQSTSLFLRITRSADSIYLSKFIFNLIFMMIICAVVTPLFVFFIGVNVIHALHFILSVIAGGLSITASTTLLAAMAAKAGGKGSLFTIISFPILLPVLWISISSTAGALNEARPEGGTVIFLLAFSGFITAISILLFRFIWQED